MDQAQRELQLEKRDYEELDSFIKTAVKLLEIVDLPLQHRDQEYKVN